MRKEKSCGAVVIRKEENGYATLLIKHTQGHWGFPKGHMEENENEVETARREVLEETGIDVDIDEGFKDESTYWPSPEVYKKVIYFVGNPHEGTPKPDHNEIEEVSWFRFSEAAALLSYPSDVSILENVQKYLRKLENADQD